MTFYLHLIFLSLITTSIQLPSSGIFLIHNEDHKLCVKAQSSSSVIVATCNQDDELQKFKWVSAHQLVNMALKLCLGVPSTKDQVAITLSPCNKTSGLQHWECRNETLLSIQGKDLFFSSAQGGKRKVMLSKGRSDKWKIYGTTENLCSQGYEAIFTLLGNAFGAPCVFPFKFNNTWYADCTKDRKAGNEKGFSWCATSTDFDEDSLFGYCPVKGNTDKDFWITNPLTDTHYQINSNSALTWHQARTSCQQQNAELLSMTELHEQNYLTGLTGRVNSELWIGLNSLNANGGWQWIGGSPFRYLNWAPGSPSLESEKICGMLQTGIGKWENQKCDRKLGYICKKGNSSLDSSITPSGDFRPIKCPSGWIPYSGRCYMIYRAPKIWKEALASCRKEGGDLASIHNIEEYSFTVSQLGYKPTDELWIGLNDLKIQMYFEWSDGTPVTYTKWLREEPSHINDRGEDCVIMKGEDGYWADDVCEKKLGYICKMKPVAEGSEEAEISFPGCQKGWIRHGFYCYSVRQTSVTFSEAKKICEADKGYLITVGDRYEQAFLTVQIGFSPVEYFWIALSDVEEQGTFKWANSEPVLFTHWNSGMPGKESGCVAMRTGTTAGLWDVVNCEKKSMFLCKQLADGVTPPPAPATTPAPSCPDGWHSSVHISSCFKYFQKGRNQMKTWFEARDFCRAIGGDLAAIHSEEEQNTIKNLDGIHSYESYWIGLNAFEPDRGFTWSDGSPVNFENWEDGEPNNYEGDEKCGVVNGYFDLQWNDLFCETLCDWICQIKKGVALKPEPSTTFEYTYKISEDGWVVFEDKEYYFSHDLLPMEKAREYCRKNSGDLVIIESESERKFLWRYSFSNDYGDGLYIGLRVSLDKKFSWMDGSPVNYVAWAPNEPNFANNDENCVVLYTRSGTWNDLNCGAPKSFICKRLNSTIHSTVAPTSPAPQGGCLQNWLLFNNKCFKIFGSTEKEMLTWNDARTACQKLEGNLASIPSAEVQAFLTSHFQDVSTDTWIGLNDVNSEYTFLWTDGSGVYYTNWATGFPNYRSEDDCVLMIKDHIQEAGKWKDTDCQSNKSYICQRNSDPKLYNFQTAVPVSGFVPYGNSSYSLISSRMNWEEAQKTCKAQYSELASILDSYSQSFLWLQVLNIGQPVWLGLNSNVTNGFYRWTDKWKMRYSNWAIEEPKQNLACVYLDVDGTWKTGSCDENYFSICKRSDVVAPTEPLQLPGKCSTSDIRKSWIPFRGHCYYFESSEIESWPHAYLECNRLGASLVSIEDLAEMNFLLDHMNVFSDDHEHFWIGLYKNVEGAWKWTDNSAVDFVNWKKGEPTTYDFNNLCGDMDSSDGSWQTYFCFYGKKYICKMPKIIEVEPTEKPSDNKALKMDQAVPAPAHRLQGMVAILVLLILVGAGLAACFFYKKRRNQLPADVSFDNTLYSNSDAVLATSESRYLVANIEQNEQDML